MAKGSGYQLSPTDIAIADTLPTIIVTGKFTRVCRRSKKAVPSFNFAITSGNVHRF